MRLFSGLMRRLETFYARVIVHHSPGKPVSIYTFRHLKRLQFMLYSDYLHLRLLLHIQLPFRDFKLPPSSSSRVQWRELRRQEAGCTSWLPHPLLRRYISGEERRAREVRRAGGGTEIFTNAGEKALSRNTAGGDNQIVAGHIAQSAEVRQQNPPPLIWD
jgi:hypothetical protein